MAASSTVDLGFVGECESWKLRSCHFPSKFGGKPSWLDLRELPQSSELECAVCKNPLLFLCQIYSPVDNQDDAFHRSIFIFICPSSSCNNNDGATDNMIALRCQLTRKNPFYDYKPPVECAEFGLSIVPESHGVTLCAVCGCRGKKLCGACRNVTYCSRHHQQIDWKRGHKKACKEQIVPDTESPSILYPELEIFIEEEKVEEKRKKTDEERMKEYEDLLKDGKTGTLQGNCEAEQDLESIATVKEDKQFGIFRDRISSDPDQVLRYERGGVPLWVSSDKIPNEGVIPNCLECGSRRSFEFQILPQLLLRMKVETDEASIDWGTLAIYTCEKSCNTGNAYKKEFIWKQNVSPDSVKREQFQ